MTEHSKFLCTPAGAIALSRRRLRLLLLGLALPMLALAIWMFAVGRFGAGLTSFGASFLAWFSWRMSGDLDPFWLEIGANGLGVQMRRRREGLALVNATTRPLEADEIEHLQGLMSTAGMFFAAGSFDSHRLGECHLYATNFANAVLVEADDIEGDDDERLRWVVTPDDRQGFVEALREAAG